METYIAQLTDQRRFFVIFVQDGDALSKLAITNLLIEVFVDAVLSL
jgi:hypothetical protein